MAFLDETGVTQLTSDIKNLADAAYTKQNVVASAYNASSTYAVGDYCIYGGQLYRCTTAIATAEAWNSAHWTSTTVTDEFTGPGVPDGGTAGQILTKASTTDYDTQWSDMPAGTFVVTITQSGSSYTADHTYAEILSAYQAKKAIYAVRGSGDVYQLDGYFTTYFRFSKAEISPTSRQLSIKSFTIYANSISYSASTQDVDKGMYYMLAWNNDMSGLYTDPPVTPLRVSYNDTSISSYYENTNTRRIMLYFEDQAGTTGSENRCEIYPLQFKRTETVNNTMYGIMTFRTVGARNGKLIAKTIVVRDAFNGGGSGQNATVTYSEEELGGGGGGLLVTTTIDSWVPYRSVNLSHSFTEIQNALNSGQNVSILADGSWGNGKIFTVIAKTSSQITFEYDAFGNGNNSVFKYHLTVQAGTTATMQYSEQVDSHRPNPSIQFELKVNNDSSYHDYPSGNLDFYIGDPAHIITESTYLDTTILYNMGAFGAVLTNGVNDHSEDTKFDIYRFAKYEYHYITSEDPEWSICEYWDRPTKAYLEFHLLGERNGNIVLKKVAITVLMEYGVDSGVYYGQSYHTVTYTETPLGTAT